MINCHIWGYQGCIRYVSLWVSLILIQIRIHAHMCTLCMHTVCTYAYVHVYYRHTIVFAKELSCSALSEVLYSPGGCSEDVMLSRGEYSDERVCVCCLPSINAVRRLSIDCGGPSEGFSPLWYCLQSYI